MEDKGNMVERVSFSVQTNRETEMFYEDVVQDGKRRFPMLKSLCIENKNEFVVENVCPIINQQKVYQNGFDLYPNERIVVDYSREFVKHKLNLFERKNVGILSPYPILKIENVTKNETIDLPKDRIITTLKFDESKVNLSDEVYIHYKTNDSIHEEIVTGKNTIQIESETDAILDIETHILITESKNLQQENPDKILQFPNTTYLDIYKNHERYVSHKHMHYLFIYDRIFQNILSVNKPIKLLEIGVQNGDSLEIWQKYLPTGSQIHGVDINEKCKTLQFGNGIHFHLGSAADRDFMDATFKDIVFDVILDDGSHISSEVISTFEFMFPKLKDGGIYIIEDINASYIEKYEGGLFKASSSMEYFKRLADFVNFQYITESDKSDLMKFLQQNGIHSDFVKFCDEHISQISFYQGVVVIEKFFHKKTMDFPSLISGEIDLIAKPKSKHINQRTEYVEHVKKCYQNFNYINEKGGQGGFFQKENSPTLISNSIEGGWTDVCRGLLATYRMCKELGFNYKIALREPFRLEDYLVPNEFDWRISDNEFKKALADDNVYTIDKYVSKERFRETLSAFCKDKEYVIIKAAPLKTISENEYALLYDEMFSPSSDLEQLISENLYRIGYDYISVTFRFQRLLGDFEEASYPILEPNKRIDLINECIRSLREIHEQNPNKKILVTSDSVTFLREAAKEKYVYTVQRDVFHPKYAKGKNDLDMMKTFLDYFLISHANEVYLIIDGLMYDSSFPKFAAIHKNKPYHIVNNNEVRLEKALSDLRISNYDKKTHIYGKDENKYFKALSFFIQQTGKVWSTFTALDVYNNLHDEESRIIYKELFNFNVVSDREWEKRFQYHYPPIIQKSLVNRFEETLLRSEDKESHNKKFMGIQYFDKNILKPTPDEVFVDAGAYHDGGTVAGFLKYCDYKYKHIYAFEPKPEFYQSLSETIKSKGIKNITLFPKGLYDKNSILSFSGNGAAFGVSKDHLGEEISVTKLDDCLAPNEKVTFIKMDIEGAELSALIGAKKTIQKFKPKLAISIYHKPKEDLIDIPAYILKLVPEYKFYIRHYTFHTGDTILYAVIEDDKDNKTIESEKNTVAMLADSQFELAKNELSRHEILYLGKDNSLKYKLTQKALSLYKPTTDQIKSNYTGLDVYEKLQDEESKFIYTQLFYHYLISTNEYALKTCHHYIEVLKRTIKNRLQEKGADLRKYENFNDSFFVGQQYFEPSFLKPDENEIYIDAGPYDSDTISGFISFCNHRYSHIYAFEPQEKMYARCQTFIKTENIKNITLIPKGLYDSNTVLRFENEGGGFGICGERNSEASKKSEKITEVPVITLDSYIDKNEMITFIKMDIEGAELKALIGATETIKRCKPKLAICIYHKPKEDLIDIPAYILNIVPEYKFYIRHHSWSMGETVLYAIIEGSKQ